MWFALLYGSEIPEYTLHYFVTEVCGSLYLGKVDREYFACVNM